MNWSLYETEKPDTKQRCDYIKLPSYPHTLLIRKFKHAVYGTANGKDYLRFFYSFSSNP